MLKCIIYAKPVNSLFKLTIRGSFSQSCVESIFRNRRKPTSGVLSDKRTTAHNTDNVLTFKMSSNLKHGLCTLHFTYLWHGTIALDIFSHVAGETVLNHYNTFAPQQQCHLAAQIAFMEVDLLFR